jgi:DNA repair exonuclease SbcCD ATPase subunit
VAGVSLKVEIENVGGLRASTFHLERGLNRVRAPNAVGKTSFTRALELLVLSEGELKGRGHYRNLFAPPEDATKVRLSGDISFERAFRQIERDDLNEVGTPSYIAVDGERILNVCFAVPGNKLIDDFVSGKGVKNYVELLAGTQNYEKVQAALHEIDRELANKIQHYRDLLIRLDEHNRQKTAYEKELGEQRSKFAKMPILDEKAIFEDYGLYREKKAQLEKVEAEIAQSRTRVRELEEIIEETKDKIRTYESQIELIKEKHPRIDARLSEIAAEIPSKKSDLDKVRGQKGRAQEKLSAAQRSEISLTKYGDEGICYACGKRLTLEELRTWERKVKEELSDYESMETGLRRTLEDLEKESRELKDDKQDLGNYEDELKSSQRTLMNRETDKKTLERAVKDTEKQKSDLLKNIQELSTSQSAYKEFEDRQTVKTLIDQRESDLKSIEQRILSLKKQSLGASGLQEKREFLQTLVNYLESRKNHIVEEVRTTFNSKVTDLYKRLGYRDFDDIEVLPDFRVSVTRKKGGKIVENFPLAALSTSERVTIGIAFLLAAKEEYVKDFPFFVLDELITSYDPERFETIRNYLKKNEDYVIFTELTVDTKDIEIVHEA